MNRHRAGLVAAIPVALVLAACSGAGSGDEGGRDTQQPSYAEGGTYTMAIGQDLAPFHPYRSFSPITRLAYDSLVNLLPDGKFVSGIADEWHAAESEATFHIRDDVTCSDGTPLHASDVASALNYIGDPANQATVYGTLVPAIPYTATGDDAAAEVKVTLDSPFTFILHTLGSVPIVCPKGISDADSANDQSFGTGPFVLDEVQSGVSYSFVRRDGYAWGPDGSTSDVPGTPEKVIVRVVENETTRANLLLSGDLNLGLVSGSDRARLESAGLTHADRMISGDWMWFNELDDRPGSDPRVREALVMALDVEATARVSVGPGLGGPATGLVESDPKPCTQDTVTGHLPAQDVAGAEALLDSAGWVEGPDGVRQKDGRPLSIDLHYGPYISPMEQPTAELMREQWSKIGVNVTLSGDSLAKIVEIFGGTSNFDVLLYGFGLSLPTQMIPYVTGSTPPDGQNLAGINNSEFEELANQAQSLALPDACTVWNAAEEALWSRLNPVPISRRAETWYVRDAEAAIAGWSIPIPTSLRLLAGN